LLLQQHKETFGQFSSAIETEISIFSPAIKFLEDNTVQSFPFFMKKMRPNGNAFYFFKRNIS